MPLTRYEIRNEYSLANPDLYRAAAKDDPEGLLEGVAMAGLVGIVRQLGDLAEFAAEVFHDLHEEVLATAARGHELLIRVQQLEAELPAVEKAMLVNTNYVNFAYNPGLEWHANIRNDQNHFTQGDLPRFIRNSYEECRGPPRLFLLDKFDVAGAGACLKRYTDPSFFKMEWASSELLKAEKEQQDKRARRIKKKRQRKRNGEIKEPSQAPSRTLDMEEDGNIPVARFRSSSLDLGANHKDEPRSPYVEQDDSAQASSSQLIHQHEEDSSNNSKGIHAEDVNETPDDTHLAVQMSHDNFASGETSEVPGQVVNDAVLEDEDMQAGQNIADDVASETDNYMDALTTMDSEVETDSELKTKPENDIEIDSYTRVDLSNLHTLNESNEQLTGHQINSIYATVEPVETKEPTVTSPLELFDKKEPIPFDRNYSSSSSLELNADGVDKSNGSSPVKINAASTSDSYLDLDSIDHVAEASEISKVNDNKESEMESMVTSFNLEPEPVVPLINGNQVKLAARSIPLDSDTHMKSEEFPSEEAVAPELESGSIAGPESSPTKAFPEHLSSPTHAQSSKLNETSSTKIFPEHLGSPSTHAQPSKFNERIPALVEEKDSFQGGSEDESSESPLELSSPSLSSDTNIQPIRWARDFPGSPNDFLDSDDEIDGMQVSSSPPSSSSSALSSPRPISLATTIFHIDHEVRPQTLLSSQESADSSPRSSTESAIRSPASPMKPASTESAIRSPASPMKPASEIVEPSVNIATCSPDVSPDSTSEPPPNPVEEVQLQRDVPVAVEETPPNPVEEVQLQRDLPVAVEETPLQRDLPAELPQMQPDFVMNELEQQPPPPPLPPLEWRMARRLRKSHLSASKNMDSSIAPSVPLSFPMRPDTTSKASKSPLVPLTTNVNSPLISETMADDLRDSIAPSVPLSFPTMPDTTSKASKSPSVPLTRNVNSPLIPETMADDLRDSISPSVPLSFPTGPDTTSKASKSPSVPLTRNANSSLIPETTADDLRDSIAPSVPLSFPMRPDTTSKASKSPWVPLTRNADSSLIPETMADDLRDSKPSIASTMNEGTSRHAEIISEFPSVQDSSDLPSPVMQIPEVTNLKDSGLSSAQPNRVLADQDDNYGANLLVPPLNAEHEMPSTDGPDLTPEVSTVDIPTALTPSKGAEQAAESIEPALSKLDRKDSLIEAIASHDRNTLRKIPERSRSSMTAPSDEREVLLEQIRTGSFSLRHTKVEKHEAPRPTTNINVAAILEKANAIRQAFAGSDDEDDDDWSDS